MHRKDVIPTTITSASLPAKKRILTVCVKLFLEQGYKKTTVSEIVHKASVSNSIFQNIFRAKDGVLTELNENLREIYIEAYTQKEASDYIFQETAKELYQIFGPYQPELTARDFYAMEIGSAGIMRSYMAHPCDGELTLEKKLRMFLTMSLRAYRVPEAEVEGAIRFMEGLNIRAIAERVMGELFRTLAMHFEFSLPDTAPGQGGDSPGQAGTT